MANSDSTHAPISRKDANALGLKRFFTGVPCKQGHVDERYTACGLCCECLANGRKKWRAKNPEQSRELRRKWRKENPEREHESHIKSNRRWWAQAKAVQNALKREARSQNPEHFREQKRRSYVRVKFIDPDRMRKAGAKWRAEKPEAWRAILSKAKKRFEERNPHWGRQKASRRRARLSGAGGSFTSLDIEDIKKMQRGRCAYCQIKLSKGFHIDHIIAVSKGGTNDRRNLQLLCAPCNLAKSARDPIVHAQTLGMLL